LARNIDRISGKLSRKSVTRQCAVREVIVAILTQRAATLRKAS
jgi:hypothetical protein